MLNKSQSNSQSFNDSELSKGFHLLTDSSDTIIVNTPSVPPNTAHLYPRLAGSNWTSYLSHSKIIIGRSGSLPTTRQKPPHVDIDFGSSKAISRKHCEIRYSVRKDRWELHVYGRNGIKLNQVSKKPKDKPSVLKTGTLIEICNTRCVFILPDNYIKPIVNEDDVNTPNDAEDQDLDQDLEAAIVNVLSNHTCLNTTEILLQVKEEYNKPIGKGHILQLLVLSPRFNLVSNSLSMSSQESDSAKWKLISTNEDIPEIQSNDNMSISEKNKNQSGLMSTDNMSISTPNENMSFSDAMSITTSTHDLNKRGLQSMQSTSSFSKYLNLEEEGFSIPDNQPTTIPFQSMSIESIYSIWNDRFPDDGNHRPTKRLKSMESNTTPGTHHHSSHTTLTYTNIDSLSDIYQEIRQKIIYS